MHREIDLGLTHFAVLSDGTKVAAPTFLRRAARKLKRLQQALSRERRGSQNRKKAVVRVARAHARVADTRRDWQHKLSTTITRENQAVYVEDLAVAGLGRTRLAKSVHDAGWASFTAMLEYKAAKYGRAFGRVDRFFPSTRMCSQCGRINDTMALNVRSWNCPCGTTHDRDVNAAINVLAAGQAESLNDRGAHVRPGLAPAARREAVTHPDTACSTRSVEGISVLQDGEDVNPSMPVELSRLRHHAEGGPPTGSNLALEKFGGPVKPAADPTRHQAESTEDRQRQGCRLRRSRQPGGTVLVRSWLADAGLVVLSGAAAAVYGMLPTSHGAAAAVEAEPAAAVVPMAVARPVAAVAPVAASPSKPSVEPVLSGKRRVTIVRVGAFESGLSLLDGGRLTEVDDDRGRQVFVPTPLGSGEFLIKAYHGGGTGQPICWQVRNPGDTQPLFVRGAACRADDQAQRFVIAPAPAGGAREYLISNRWAYLRDSARSGLILEELGDAPSVSSFRFNDTGPAPRQK
ncbi:hypothetical protein GCM10011608_07200 [Micromonospora sonchi]|uniref:Transposase n=2 Tax=Micromonospora sonchi TaxID=1763543 RepID=A0A917WS55_9ACTN|nr:hypothetical protein GCM10011608_07200 [Micromonospora sonchi]